MTEERQSSHMRRTVSFVAGIALFLMILLLPAPEGLTVEGKRIGAMVALMACWWIGEAISIGVTALVPLAAAPLLGAINMKDAAAPYADHNIFLFMGGFFIAMAMQKWNLHKRIALKIVSLIGFKPRRIILGFMVATAFLSMWISNTATTLMMIPIAVALLKHFGSDEKGGGLVKEMGPAVALGIAYSASIGGMGTLVGTPPNIIFAKVARESSGFEANFLGWMVAAMPFVILFIPIMWFLLTRVLHRVPNSGGSGAEVIESELEALGPMSSGEKMVAGIFCLTALLWITRADIDVGTVKIPGWASLFPHPEYIKDSTVAIAMSLLMFLIPVGPKRGDRLLDIEWAMKIPWDVILLLGGGFSLAHAVEASGLGAWVGGAFEPISRMPSILVIAAVCLIISLLTEIMSNTASATLFLPILAAAASKAGMDPLFLMMPATMAASCAFILPSGTPPNAIVFATGAVTLPQMSRTGIYFDFLAVALLSVILPVLSLPLLGE